MNPLILTWKGNRHPTRVFQKIKLGPSSLGLLAKAAIMAKYVHKSERNEWSFSKAKSTIAESIEMGQTVGMEKLQERLAEEFDMYPLCDAIGLAYLGVLRDCEIHCSAEVAWQSGQTG